MKKILILGGTGFVGRILTEELIKSGSSPVLFNRGIRNAGIFPELRKFKGDRLKIEDIKQIAYESWDVVIDFSCMFPDNLDGITDMLMGKAGRYIFVSTASVYPMDDPAKWIDPVNEDAETLPCTAEQRKDPDVLATYGQKKAECERDLLEKDWLDSIIFRPALIYGWYDPTDRFYYWLWRVQTQNEILIHPGNDKLTNTYSEDFAKLIQTAIDIDKHEKIYNAVTHSPVTIKEYLDITCRLLKKTPKFVELSTEFLEENKVQPWGDLPMWLGGMNLVLDNSKVLKVFPVKFQSFEESVKGCIDYYSALGWKEPAYGISPAKERELIEKSPKNQ